MMVKVKVCGLMSAQDAVMCVTAGADALGFNFYTLSPRYVSPERAGAIRLTLPPFVATVGIFVDHPESQVREIMEHCGLAYAQLHGQESPRTVASLRQDMGVIKAVRIATDADLRELERYEADAFLLDAYVPGKPGGTGQSFDWEVARRAASRARIVLAGGLTPENVAGAVEAARPYAVDVASGVETEPGRKDRKLVNRFIRAAKAVEL